MRPNSSVILVGYCGAGKTTVGCALAKRLSCEHVDLDDWLRQSSGGSLKDLFASQGSRRVRALERRLLSELTTNATRLVLSTSAGTPLSRASRRLLRKLAVVVWLDAPRETLLARVRHRASSGHEEPRPDLLTDEGPVILARELPGRSRAYHQVAHLRVDVGHMAAEEAVDWMVGWLERRAYHTHPLSSSATRGLYALMGPDGVGKTTTGLAIVGALRSQGHRAQYHHLNPWDSDRDEPPPLHAPERSGQSETGSLLPALLRPFRTLGFRIEWAALRALLLVGYLVLFVRARFDRIIHVVDRTPLCLCYSRFSSKYRSGVHRWCARHLPAPRQTYLLAAAPAVIASRKAELSLEQIEALLEFEDEVLRHSRWNFKRVSAVAPSEEVAQIIQSDILSVVSGNTGIDTVHGGSQYAGQ